MKAILGKKIGMTQIFAEDGRVIPVTMVKAGPCVVIRIKDREKDGYSAIQIGFGQAKEKRVSRPLQGYFAKAGIPPQEYLAEVRTEDAGNYQVGQEIKADLFSVGEKTDVTGISIGKGFAGVIKRWGFSGGPASHGSHSHRRPGSIGATTTPGRVFKGKKMPGHMGNRRITVQNLEVVSVDPEQDILLLKGSTPGSEGSLLMVKSSVKTKAKKKAK